MLNKVFLKYCHVNSLDTLKYDYIIGNETKGSNKS